MPSVVKVALTPTMLDQLIAWAALLFSGIALIVALRVQRRQPELIAKQIAELDRGTRARQEARVVVLLKRDASLSGVHLFYKVSVINEGPAEARDINLIFPNGNSPILADEVSRKLPVPVLQARGQVDLIASLSNDAAPPFHVLLRWRDGRGDQTQETTLS